MAFLGTFLTALNGWQNNMAQPKTIPFGATPLVKPKTIPFRSVQTATMPVKDPTEDSFFQKLFSSDNEQGLLPYEDISKALTPDMSEAAGGVTPWKTAGAIAGIVPKLGVGIAGFLDPVANLKKINSLWEGALGAGTQFEETRQTQQGVKDYIPQLQQAILKLEQSDNPNIVVNGQPKLVNLKRLLKEAGGSPIPDLGYGVSSNVEDFAKALPKATYEVGASIVPPVKIAIDSAMKATDLELINQYGDASLKTRIAHGIHLGLTEFAENPDQLAMLALMGSKPKAGGGFTFRGDTKIGGMVDTGISKVGGPIAKPIEAGVSKVRTGYQDFKANRAINVEAKAIAQREAELAKIENNYVKLRKNQQYSSDQNAGSRKRVAETDVLVGSVDTTGTLITVGEGKAADLYKKMTLDNAEGVVRNNLVREGSSVNLEQVRQKLIEQVNNSGLEGKNLETALRNIEKEINGYARRADEFGNVPLQVIHDAKIDTTNSINFATPPETKLYNKTVARGLKEVVEENSQFNVREVNAELGKYLQDIKYLESLNGRKVKGGKLGTYFAKVTGNVIGGVAGHAIGGPVGSAFGTVIGGEVAGRMKGSSMAGTFGMEAGRTATQSPVITKAIELSKTQKEGMTVASYRESLSRQAGMTTQEINIPTKNPSISIPSRLPENKGNVKIKAADLGQKKMSPLVKINKYDSNFPKYLTPDQLSAIAEQLIALENKGRTLDMKSVDAVIKRVVPMTDINGFPKSAPSSVTDSFNQKMQAMAQQEQAKIKAQRAPQLVSEIKEALAKETTQPLKDSPTTMPLNAPESMPAKPKVDPLIAEAQKYKSAEKFIGKMKGSSTQYGDYAPNSREYLPNDFKNITELGVKPEKTVTIYRGIDDITGKVKKQINDGDFVTTDFDSAASYAGKDNVVSMEVKAKHLYNDNARDFVDDPFYIGSEYVYSTKKIKLLPSDSQLTDIYNQATKNSLVGQKAIDSLVQQKTGEIKGGLTHPDLGKIDLVWGDGTHGLSHIDPAIRNKLAEIISNSKLVEKGQTRAFLETADHRSVIGLDWEGTPKQWVLTSYEKK